MKILHTGDWHIGKIINNFSMLEDQKYILNQLYSVLQQEKPDVILISGDIYDRSIPPKEAVELLNETLTKIIEEFKIPTLIIAGNHDSQERLSFGNKMLEHKKLYIEGMFTSNIKKVTLNDDFGPIHFYMVPYSHPALIRSIFDADTIHTHDEAFGYIMKQLKDDFNKMERNVLLTHNYILSNSETILTSESERSLSIGGSEYVDVSHVEDFDYVALGHLHQPQKVKHDHIRYSGSLLKYSFSEAERNKGFVLIDIKEKGHVETRFIEIKPEKDMRIIEGELKTLVHPDFYKKMNCQDYLLVKLTDTTDLYDPLSSLRAVYPNVMQIQRNRLVMNVESQTKANSNFKEKSKYNLFEEFYQNIMGQNLEEKKKRCLEPIIDEVIKGGNQS